MAERNDGATLGARRTMEAEKTWRRRMGKVDMPKLVTALRQVDVARTMPSNKRAA